LRQALSESELPLGFEDRFVVVGVPASQQMAPHPDTAEAFGHFLHATFKCSQDLSLIVDVRRLNEVQNDVSDFLESLAAWIPASRCTILIQPAEELFVRLQECLKLALFHAGFVDQLLKG
jgi:hypothetical protein